jgi:tetratricopeptide (TPR) repeat protein
LGFGLGDEQVMNKVKFNQLCSVLISLFAVFAAIIGYVQAGASGKESLAERDSRRYALQAFGLSARGHAKGNFAYYEAFKAYYQLQKLSEEAVEIPSEVFDSAAEELTQHSQLFKEYYDKDSGSVEILRYESDLYVREVTRLEQNYQAAYAVKRIWNHKSTTHIAHLTLLAVSLFLLGQASTLRSDSTCKFMLGSGLFLACITLIWTLVVWAKPVPDLRDTGAIDFYAKGVALEHQNLTKEATAEFDQAIKAAPDYLDAYIARAESLTYLQRYADAAKDYEKAWKLSPHDSQVAARLSKAYYKQGKFALALQFIDKAILLSPKTVEYETQKGLIILALGKAEEAQTQYDRALETAAHVVAAREVGEQPPSYIWERLDEASLDLEYLQSSAEGEGGNPPKDQITNTDAVIEKSIELQTIIDSFSISLEYTGKPPGQRTDAELSDLTFGLPIYIDGELDAEIKEYPDDTFPAGTNEVVVQFTFDKIKDGQELVMRVFHDAEELPSWRFVDSWVNDGEENETIWYKVLSPGYSDRTKMDAGRYFVEFFIDGNLHVSGGFDISETSEE